MKMKIITIGRPKLSFAQDGFDTYMKRLRAYHKVEVVHLNDRSGDERMLREINNRYCVVLDERGQELTSRELAQFIVQRSLEGIGEICFIVGGPDGHGERIKEHANIMWSFGKLTLPHDLAMIVLAEALYRASTIIIGHPYHRE